MYESQTYFQALQEIEALIEQYERDFNLQANNILPLVDRVKDVMEAALEPENDIDPDDDIEALQADVDQLKTKVEKHEKMLGRFFKAVAGIPDMED